MEKLTQLYKNTYKVLPKCCEALPGAGSNRKYFRLVHPDGTTVIGVDGTSVDENLTFVALARHFRSKGLNVPEVVAVSEDGTCYLQTDLGHRSLYDALKKGRTTGMYSREEVSLLKKTMAALPVLQVKGAEGLDFSVCYPVPAMDRTNIFFDLNYFKYCFLKVVGVDFHEMQLEQDFNRLAADLMDGSDDTFLYRDFQARNVMLDEDDVPFFIDFQGGRRGPLEYDVASFLWQASARYGAELRNELVEIYLDALSEWRCVDRDGFKSRLRLFVLFRILQVLGAYGFRGYIEKKQYFLNSIPPAMENLHTLLRDGVCDPYPYLSEVLRLMEKRVDDMFPVSSLGQPTASSCDGQGVLVVRVFSFSYKKGIPDDESGNGGGYVFDCRSTHNPGRYEPYKNLTGLQKPVIDFLENDGEILNFLASVYQLADAHVERYMKRGFTDLMFSFGCTGGQHRSVYAAQHLAEHLHDKYGIEVRICHREQKVNQKLEARK